MGWEWARVDILTIKLGSGSTPRGGAAVYKTSGVPFIRSQNVYNDGLRLSDVVFIDESTNEQKLGSIVAPNDLLLNITGGSIGRCAVVPADFAVANVNQHVMIVRLLDNVFNRYIHSVITSDYIQNQILSKQSGSGRGGLSAETFSDFLLPISPLSEQHRIVGDLDKYLALVDEIESNQSDLDSLYSQLRSKVLDLAVRGQLTEQNSTDEPASELLNRIREERKALVAAGKAKPPKGGDSIICRASDGGHYEKRGKKAKTIRVPFELPEDWEWARLGSIVWHRQQMVPDSMFSYIDIGSIDNTNQRLNSKETLIEAKDAPSRARKPVELGDVLYSTVRPYLHNACLVDRKFSAKPIASTGFAAMVCHSGILNSYLLRVLLSPYFDLYANASGNSTGSSYPAINDAALYRGLIPIPPLAEQQRIVAKIDQLQAALTNQ